MPRDENVGSVAVEKVIPTICHDGCAGPCVLKVHVKDGMITRIETDDSDTLQYRACMKGRARRQVVYHPDRLKYPMKRVGERGEGKFQRISWDEALGAVAGELKRVYQTYGPSAVLLLVGGGNIGHLHRMSPISRLLCLLGGYSRRWGSVSYEGAVFASLATYGTDFAVNSRDDLLNSKLIVMWGLDVANTALFTNTKWFVAQAREKGTKVVSIDPRHTDSTATLAHQWIPIRPGTDTAMLIAMAYVMIKEDLQDQAFLDAYTVGFDQFKEYVLGISDGVAKKPEWAEAVTGVSADTIRNLAREYAITKPAALMPGWGPGRTANGEQFHRACIVLSAMSGNVGIHGGNSGLGAYWKEYGYSLGQVLPAGANAVERDAPRRKDALRASGVACSTAAVHSIKVWDAILEGKAGGYPADYKLLFLTNSNYLNQCPNVNKGVKALKTLEFIVVQDQFLTSTAKFADILLPVTAFMERSDVTTGGGPPFYGYMNRAIGPFYETKPDLEIAQALAEQLGIPDFNHKTEEELLREIVAGSKELPDYDTFKKNAIHRVKLVEPLVAFKEQIEDPKNHPFPTPSGKIEIFSQEIADMNNPLLPPIPKYIETWEGPNDPLARKYPLQLITTHPKLRVHSSFYNVPWLSELETQSVMVNTADAVARGIKNGDLVRVFNDRGEMMVPAKVTERIMPGVVDIPEGAWHAPDEQGIDRGGCANVLTQDAPSPGGAFPANTVLVQVEKA